MTTGVLLMAHGTPSRPSEIASFYTRIRRGRPPTPEQLAELKGRYAAIGGVSPLTLRTAAQVAAVRASLEARRPGHLRGFLGLAVSWAACGGSAAICTSPPDSLKMMSGRSERSRSRHFWTKALNDSPRFLARTFASASSFGGNEMLWLT